MVVRLGRNVQNSVGFTLVVEMRTLVVLLVVVVVVVVVVVGAADPFCMK